MEGTESDRWSIAFFSSLATCCILIASVVGLGWWVFSRPVAAGGSAERTIYARADFTAMVQGKTEEEVEELVGKPDSTSRDSDAVYWHFRNRTRDPAGKEADTDVQLVFREGKVASVNY
jgi:hypothetical protein